MSDGVLTEDAADERAFDAPVADAPSVATPSAARRRRWGRLGLLALIGPGLMVMLADTDAGCIVTAAQSGARFGYRLLPLQIVLVPVLYLVMELTARLAISTGKGHARLIAERFGRPWAILAVATLLVGTTGALVTEFAGLAAVGGMVGLPAWVVVPASACFLALVVVSGSYRRVERIGIGLGLFELAFLAAAIRAHPSAAALAGSLWSHQPLGNPSYLSLAAANVGAVIMPWMVFYQQSAIVDKGLTRRNLRAARVDTAVGAVVTQVVMIAVLVAAGAALYGRHAGSLATVSEISDALTPSLGAVGGRVAFALGIGGAALVAGIVVSLAAAWAFAETVGTTGSLNHRVRRAPLFYGVYFASLVVATALVLSSRSLVHLSVGIELMNALLLPFVLGFLVALAWTALPREHRLGRVERVVLVAVVAAVSALGLAVAGAALGL